MSKSKATVGAPILYFPSGSGTPLPGVVASVATDGKINIAYLGADGSQMTRQDVTVADDVNEAGDYVVVGSDAEGAIKAHAAAAKKAGQGEPPEGKEQTEQQKKDAKASMQRGDFTSAAASSDNKQPAGSGGPFDPANTAKAHMSVNQTQESASPGNPTTGGMTPKLSAENMHTLSERDQEAARAIIAAKTPAEKTLAANAGTGAATPGTAEMIVNPEKAPHAPAQAPAQAQSQPKPVQNEEADRLARDEARHKVAVEESAKIAGQRPKADQPAAKKAEPPTSRR